MTAGPRGSFSALITIPRNVAAGTSHVLVALGGASGAFLTEVYTVTK
jgi:hypothetical protein